MNAARARGRAEHPRFARVRKVRGDELQREGTAAVAHPPNTAERSGAEMGLEGEGDGEVGQGIVERSVP